MINKDVLDSVIWQYQMRCNIYYIDIYENIYFENWYKLVLKNGDVRYINVGDVFVCHREWGSFVYELEHLYTLGFSSPRVMVFGKDLCGRSGSVPIKIALGYMLEHDGKWLCDQFDKILEKEKIYLIRN